MSCAALAKVELELRRRGLRWRPNPGPQAEVLASPAQEILYGGAAGGGKTSLLVNLARQYHYSSLLLRRTYPQVRDTLEKESRKWYGSRRFLNKTEHAWEWPDGRRVRFGHLEHDDDRYQYQGAEYDFLGIDELTQLNQLPYEYLLSRLRSTRPGQRVRVLCTSNPGGTGHAWVKRRWAPWLDERYPYPAAPGEIRWFARNVEGQEVEVGPDHPDGISRTFIPARLADNPYLGDEYRRMLALMPEPYRSHLLSGDWTAGEEDDAYQVIPTSWVRAAQARWTADLPHLWPPESVGCDVAHGGDDRTTLAFRRGAVIFRLDAHPGRMTPDGQAVVGLLALALRDGGWGYLDAMPPSALDIARGMQMRVSGCNFATHSDARDRSGQFGFANLRAELYWRLREALDPALGVSLILPPDTELLQELTEPRWSMTLSGIKIESKDDIKDRLGRSPDKADAVVLAVWGVGREAIPIIHTRNTRSHLASTL